MNVNCASPCFLNIIFYKGNKYESALDFLLPSLVYPDTSSSSLPTRRWAFWRWPWTFWWWWTFWWRWTSLHRRWTSFHRRWKTLHRRWKTFHRRWKTFHRRWRTLLRCWNIPRELLQSFLLLQTLLL